jgi:hypothetical protein
MRCRRAPHAGTPNMLPMNCVSSVVCDMCDVCDVCDVCDGVTHTRAHRQGGAATTCTSSDTKKAHQLHTHTRTNTHTQY